jgi:LTXXQ motif family protein
MRDINKKPLISSRTIRNCAPLKIAASAGVIGLMLSAAAGTAFAAGHPGGGGGGAPHIGGGGGAPHIGGGGAPHFGGGGAPHFGGGGAPHFGGGGAPHFSAPHVGGAHPGGVPHFAGHAAPHVNFAGHGAPHFAGHAARFARPAFHAHGGAAGRFAHVNHGIVSHGIASHAQTNININHAHLAPSAVHPSATNANSTNAHALAAAHALPAARQAAFHSDPHAFAEHRHQFAENGAFRPFWHHGWHRFHHLGWIGPVFWPYAYGDFFYYALWPDYYYDVDPFWAYGYGDIYSAMFSPYDYSDYVRGPSAPARMATLTQNMAQSCSDEAAEVTGWPIDQIQSAVQPTQEQSALLDDLGNALVKASDEVKAHCPTTVAFTPAARLDAMQQRLQALVDAVNIVSPALDKFYDSLSDEQKARFNAIATPGGKRTQSQSAQNPQAQCNASVMAWPGDQIDRVVRPNDVQREKLQALQSASAQASDLIKAACPTEIPATPPARLAAVGKRLDAMLQAVGTVRPALADFYSSLSDDQKARFNTMGKQLFAENSE